MKPVIAQNAGFRSHRFQSDVEAGEAPETLVATLPDPAVRNAAELAFAAVRGQHRPTISRPYAAPYGPVFQQQVPIFSRGVFDGVLLAEVSVESLLRYFVPTEVRNRHSVSLLDADQRTLAATVLRQPGQDTRPASIVRTVVMAPADNGMQVRTEGFRTSIGLVSNTLFWMVVLLSVMTLWMLLGTWRHVRRRLQIQSALVSEANFRRAMENSMLTGMRAIDRKSVV